MTICILSYKTQWRSQEVEVEGQNILSTSPLLMEMNKHIGGELRVKPKRRARSARDLRSKPEPKAKPEIERGRGLGRGLGDTISRKFLKIRTRNRAIWWKVQAKIHLFPVADHGICQRWVQTSFRSQPNAALRAL